MRILVTGASGQLGSYLLRHFAGDAGYEVAAWAGSRGGTLSDFALRQVDLRRQEEIAAAFADARPDVIIHTAAISRVDLCHADPQLARQVNVRATEQLAILSAKNSARLVYVSTDLVFDGHKGNYRELDPAEPLSEYGRTKLAAEECVLGTPRGVVARVSLLFGPSLNGQPSFFGQQLQALREGRPITLFRDEWRTPLSLSTAASALVTLAASEVAGRVHLGGPERMSRWEMGQRLAKFLGCDSALVKSASQDDVTFPEPRPRDVSLDSSYWRSCFSEHPWPNWENALSEMGVSV